jgi:protein gp37
MAENSKIEWTHHTFNPWRGCTKVADGCAHCYADTLSKRNPKTLGTWGPNGTRVIASERYWRFPPKWNRDAEGAAERPRVFCASLADVFEDWDGPIHYTSGDLIKGMTMADIRRDLFALIDATPHLDWLLLTKRPENILKMWPDNSPEQTANLWGKPGGRNAAKCRPNVWLLTSIATQADADRNVPLLLKCRDLAPVLGISAEPLVGPVDLGLDRIWCRHCLEFHDAGRDGMGCMDPTKPCFRWEAILGDMLDWVIAGGESGGNARPCVIEHIDDLRRQCTTAGVAFPVTTNANLWDFEPHQLGPWGDYAASARIKMRDKKGGDWNEWPAELRVREYPNVLEAVQ